MTSESKAVDDQSDSSTALEQPRIVRYLLLAGAFLPVVAMTVAVIIFRNDFDKLRTIEGLEPLGYTGILIANVIGSGSFVLPVPGIATVIIGATIWNPLLVALAGRNRLDYRGTRRLPCRRRLLRRGQESCRSQQVVCDVVCPAQELDRGPWHDHHHHLRGHAQSLL